MEKHSAENLRKLFAAGIVVNGDMWFFTSLTNELVSMSLDRGQASYILDIKGYQPRKDGDTDFLLYEDEKIYKLGTKGEWILEYSIGENSCRYIETGFRCQRKWGNFIALAKWKEDLYIFLRMEEAVFKINRTTGKSEKVFYHKDGKTKKENNFCKSCQTGDVVWLFSGVTKTVFAYHMSRNFCRQYHLAERIDGCRDVVWKENKFYILDKQCRVFVWDANTDRTELVADFKEINAKPDRWGKLVVTDEDYILLPYMAEEILLLERKGEQKKRIYASYPNDFKYNAPSDWSKYTRPCEDEYNYYFPMHAANYILKIDKKTGNLAWIKMTIMNEDAGFQAYCRESDGVIVEKIYPLSEYVERIKAESSKKENRENAVVGKAIWNQIKNAK